MENRRPLLRRRWDPFVNMSGETIPPWSCMRMEQTLEGLNAYKPNDEESQQVMFNGPMPVASGASGLATFDEPIEAAFNTDEGPPLTGGEWGPVDGEWRLGATGSGFVTLGPIETDRAMFLVGTGGDEFPDDNQVVTNVCWLGETKSLTFSAPYDIEVVDDTPQLLAGGEYLAQKGSVKIKAVVLWTDPNYNASTGDCFGFYLTVDDAEYTGAPEYFITAVANGATTTKEMVWDVSFENKKTVLLKLFGYRVSGSRTLTANSATRIELDGGKGMPRVEYREMISTGITFGPKVCIDDPKNCCVDDQGSDTSSRDTASRTPFPLIYSWGDTATCIDAMGWRGEAVHGPFGSGGVSVAKRFKVTLPSFEPYAFSAGGIAVPACDPRIADYLSGRQVIIETAESLSLIGPEIGQSWETAGTISCYYNPEAYEGCTSGSCGYGDRSLGQVLQSETDPAKQITTYSECGLGATWGYGLQESYGTPTVPKRIVFILREIVAGLTIRAASADFIQWFFDESITLPLVNSQGYVAGDPGVFQNPASPYYGINRAGIRATGNVTLEPY